MCWVYEQPRQSYFTLMHCYSDLDQSIKLFIKPLWAAGKQAVSKKNIGGWNCSCVWMQFTRKSHRRTEHSDRKHDILIKMYVFLFISFFPWYFLVE